MSPRNRLAACFAAPIAHRGLHAGRGPGPVENTIAAARAAIEAGFGIECDVQLSRDGEAMVFHDGDLDRLTAMRGPLSAQDTATLETLRLGATDDTIPTLAAFLATIAGRVPLVVEIKRGAPGDVRLADRVLALVATYDGNVVIESFDPAIVLHCLNSAPCPIGLVGPAETTGESIDAALTRCDFVSWGIDDLARIAARAPNLPRTSWTIRTPAQRAEAARHAAQIVFEGFDPHKLS